MFGFTRKTDYALVALASLAELPAEGPDPATRLSARQISERYGVPLPVLMGVLKNLVGGGIVRSTRGARGGYALARRPEGISVHDVICAIEGPVSVTTCCEPEAALAPVGPEGASPGSEGGCATDCSLEVRCPISSSVRQLNRQIHDYLSRITLADLMKEDLRAISPTAVRVHDLQFRPISEEGR
jgi:Rrf2 family protein